VAEVVAGSAYRRFPGGGNGVRTAMATGSCIAVTICPGGDVASAMPGLTRGWLGGRP
jgi:hypothetical protein